MWNDIARHVIVRLLFFLPAPRRRSIDRWWRGREEYRKLQAADWLLVSWGKSGRTWLRVMLSRFYETHYHLARHAMLGFDNLHRENPSIPRVLFTHGNYLRDYTGHGFDTKIDYRGKKTVYLMRDPRDVAVSQYFQWKFRMRPHKKYLNDYPPHGSDLPIFDFIMKKECGLPMVISYCNGWIRGIPDVGDVLMVRYEDMRNDPGTVLARILEFTGTPASESEIADAVEYAAYERLQKREAAESPSIWRIGWRLVPGDKDNPDSFKVRRGKVGGYRDYFSDEELAVIDDMLERDLVCGLGYKASEQPGEVDAPVAGFRHG